MLLEFLRRSTSEVLDSTVNSRSSPSMRPAGISAFCCAQRVLDILHGQAVARQPVAIDPDAHGIAALAEDRHVGDAGQVLEAVDDIAVDIVGEFDGAHLARSGT